jgi:hypothetical protein
MDWKLVRKIFSFFLAWLMLSPAGPPVGFAQAGAAKEARRASTVKAAVLKLGAGKDARVMLTLEDRQKLSGYVDKAQDDGFLVGNLCADQVTRVPYGGVRGLRGLNVATGTRVSVGGKVKGASKLGADPLCGTTIIQAKRNGHYHDTIVGVCVAAFFIILLTVYVVESRAHSD